MVVGVSSYALSDESNLRVLLGVAGGGIDDGEGAAVVLVVAGIAAAAVAAEGAVAVLKVGAACMALPTTERCS